MKKLKKYIALVSMLLCVSVAQAQENQTDTCAVNVSDSTEVEERPRWLHLKTNAVGLAYYNFAFNGKYRYQDHLRQTPALGGGLSIGYRLPLKSTCWMDTYQSL